jgi:hypothetical protein
MRHLLMAASAVALVIALWAGAGEAVAAPVSVRSPTSPGVVAVDVSYNRRHRSYYAYEDVRSHNCDGGGYAGIRELQRFWPQTLWPPSMRCFPYR